MKRYNKLFALAALVIVGQASAQISASATGEANARIIKGLSMFKTADLEFSEIISNGTGGTVTVNAEGNDEYDGVNAYPGSAAPQPAQFDVRGEADKHFTTELPKSITIKNESDETMTVHEFTIASKGGYILDSDGMDVLSFGATLNVNAKQAAGFTRANSQWSSTITKHFQT